MLPSPSAHTKAEMSRQHWRCWDRVSLIVMLTSVVLSKKWWMWNMINNKMEYLDLGVLKKVLRVVFVLHSPPTTLKQYPCWLEAIHFIVTAMGWMAVLPKFLCWNPNLQDDGIRRWGLWEVIRLQKPSYMEFLPLWRRPKKTPSLLLPWEVTAKRQPTKKSALPRYWLNLPVLDLGLPSLQNRET